MLGLLVVKRGLCCRRRTRWGSGNRILESWNQNRSVRTHQEPEKLSSRFQNRPGRVGLGRVTHVELLDGGSAALVGSDDLDLHDLDGVSTRTVAGSHVPVCKQEETGQNRLVRTAGSSRVRTMSILGFL